MRGSIKTGRLRHQRLEIHFAENVFLEIDAGRDLRELQPVLSQPEHAALGDIEHGLARFSRDVPAERDVFHLVHEFPDVAVTQDLQCAVVTARPAFRPRQRCR